jgi:cytochrome c oxidase cbb3-type subunit IV
MNFTIVSSIVTLVSLLVFIGIVAWVFSARNKDRFEQLARLPIDNEDGK